MQSISNKDILNYDGKTRLAPAVAFDYDKDTHVLTIADNSVYPSGDSRKQVNVEAFDKFGGVVRKSFTEEGEFVNDSESSDGVANSFGLDLTSLNKTEGVEVIATVVSTLGRTSTGSISEVGTEKFTGSLYMSVVR
jgi:hypothetical protein